MNPDARLPYPRIVMIQTTSRCNSACVMCPWPATAKTLPQGTMDDALYDKILKEIADHPEIELAMPYLMNEPLLDPKLPERIDRLKEAAPQATVYLLSNGVALNDELSEKLLASKLDWIGFSVHALYPETYKKITGRSDGERVIGAIGGFVKKAKAAKKHAHYVMVTFTRMRPHVSKEEADEAMEHWRALGVDPLDYQDGYLSRAGNVTVYGEDRIYRPRTVGCKTVWAYRIASVLFNGDVVPCCMDWGREVVWGNLRRESLADIWSGGNRARFLDAIHSGKPLPPGFICMRCEEAIPAQAMDDELDDDEAADEAATTDAEPIDDTAPDAAIRDMERRSASLRKRMESFAKRRARFAPKSSDTN